MARKRRPAPAPAPARASDAPARSAPAPAPAARPQSAAPLALPREPADDGWASALLALMIFLSPSLGVPSELMLQDTLKSIVVALCTLVATFLLLMQVRKRKEPLRWHALLWLPIALMLYALGSMVWSHTYLGGVEAIRWFLFSLIMWLALNTFTRERLTWLAAGVHAGAVVASIWAAMQFWASFGLFPQGPEPSSTFINRNFFAEFAVCTIPFGALLLARMRRSSSIALLAASNAFVILAIMMTGTRAALMALFAQVLVLLPLIAWRCRSRLDWPKWNIGLRALAFGVLAAVIVLGGLIPCGNQKIIDEGVGTNALQRAFQRSESIGPNDPSLGLRMVMWRATITAIRANPVFGLGAGAWEDKIPLYQAEGSQLETDYYVHNEFLQLVAEYGLVGWAFLLALIAYLLNAAWRSWRAQGAEALDDQPWRAVMLTSLFALLLVSNAGFAWRMASTGALFALCLGGLAASDARLAWRARWAAQPLRWSPRIATACTIATAACFALALYITQQAAEAERKLVQAAKLALTVTESGHPNSPEFNDTKRQILELVREGVAINRHYRKITPMVADELARWGDWKDATWIWESVLSSRPYIVAIISNAARGHATLGEMDKAMEELARAKKIQPLAPSVRSLEVILLARSGQEDRAYVLAKEAWQANIVDFDLVNALYLLAMRAKDYGMAEQALQRRMHDYPNTRALSLIQLGSVRLQQGQPQQALELFREGIAQADPPAREALLQQVPPEMRAQVATPAASAPQTSANSR